MARKKTNEDGFWNAIKKETVEGITAIIFILISIFLILSAFGKAGFIGDFSYTLLEKLFGVGYYLLPIILIFLGISFIKSLSENVAWPKFIAGFFMLITGLGVLDILVDKGGIIGKWINIPLLAMFDVWMTSIVHAAIFIISILVIFELSIKLEDVKNWFGGIFRKKESEEDEEEEVEFELPEEDEEDETDEDEVEDEEVEEAPKKQSGLIFFSKKSSHLEEYKNPPLSLLQKDSGKPEVGDIKTNANMIKRTLANFGIQAEMDEISIGPSVTRYAIKPAEGVKLSKIVSLQRELALALAAQTIRIEAPIPGKSLVGIEIPNTSKTTVGLGTLLKVPEFADSAKPLLLGVGKDVSGKSFFADLGKAPHMLIAGATGAGKSVAIHTLITSLLYRNSPEMLKFIMVDPKRVELTMYNKIPHLLTPVITDAKKTILSLKWAAKEMSRRYDVLESHGVRDITSYHKNVLEPAIKKDKESEDLPETMPFIIIVIDELADIMQTYPRELEAGIVRLAQMSRAVGIHLIISTQRPSVNVITGLIKANVPTRVALQVASQIDSRTILDMPGAEKLLGRGDMLFLGGEMSQPRRVQSAFISEEEVKKVVDYLHKNYKDELPEDDINLDGPDTTGRDAIFEGMEGVGSDDDEPEDDLYDEAKAIVISAGKGSTSYLQRKLRIGYSRAARIMDILEDKGIIGPAEGSKPREVLVGGDEDEDEEEEE